MKSLKVLTVFCLLGTGVAFASSAQENWEMLCAKCHAADGSGSTKMGKKLKLKDYTKVDSLKEATDAQLEKDILDGVEHDGKQVMKGYKDDLSPDDAKALVAYIRAMAK